MNKIKEKIEKLLALAEGTTNEHERDAFTAKAQRLMLEWGIEAAELESRGEVRPEEIVEVSRTWETAFASTWVQFSHTLARGMGNLRVLKGGSRNRQTAFVIGHKTDVENFWTLMNSLEHQATTALKAWWKEAPERFYGLSGWEQYKCKREFLVAFGGECGRRLRELREEIHVDVTPGAALVLVSKEQRVEHHMNTAYGNLRKGSGLKPGLGGARAGREAGSRANLGGKAVAGSRAGIAR